MYTDCKKRIFSSTTFHSQQFQFSVQLLRNSTTNNDVVDGDVYEFDKESNEAHDSKSNCSCHGNFLEFFPIWFGTPLH
uniref:Uncharacterized protein n=1 Tax=Anguilla anguilla TaxID=7936 RepID=A0A0E9W7W9_ANGAN